MSSYKTKIIDNYGRTRTITGAGTDWHVILHNLGATVKWNSLNDFYGAIETFDESVTLIAGANASSYLRNLGFTDVIDATTLNLNDTFTYENGNYYKVTQKTANQLVLTLYYSNGDVVSTTAAGEVNISVDLNDSDGSSNIAFFVRFFPENLALERNNFINDLVSKTHPSSSILDQPKYGMWNLGNYRREVDDDDIDEWIEPLDWPLAGIPPYFDSRLIFYTGLVYSETTRASDFNTFYTGVNLDGDPNANNPDGPASTGGGNGGFDRGTDGVGASRLPGLSAVDTGFISIYNPSEAQLQSLATYMWSGPFDLNAFKKIFANPMDAILGLSIVPVTVPNGGTKNVKIGNIDTGVSMTIAGTQWVTVNCGTLNVKTAANNTYLDYSPYTKCYLYLPYVGTHQIDVDDIMRGSIQVVYNVDILSGAVSAQVLCKDASNGSLDCMYEFSGACSSQVPVTGQNFNNLLKGIFDIASNVGTMVATGGEAVPMYSGKAGAALSKNFKREKYNTMVQSGLNIVESGLNMMKADIGHSGAIGSTAGMLGHQKPKLIMLTPRLCTPANANAYQGYPSFISGRLGNLSGFTIVETLRLGDTRATGAEAAEIIELLGEGAIL